MTLAATYDIGDAYRLVYTLTDASGTPTNATVTVSVTKPDGTADSAALTNPATGTYVATGGCTAAGTWLYRFSATGALTDAEPGSFVVMANTAADTYCTLGELKAYLAISGATHDQALEDAIASASRTIDQCTGRRFYADTSATARIYYPDSLWLCDVDDISTTTSLAIATDAGNDGTYETTWATTDYQLEPINGVQDGESGWPYWRIRAVAGRTFPCVYRDERAPVQVTAKWGWPSVPVGVRQACKMLGAEIHKLADAPFGVAGFDSYGVVRVRENPRIAKLLNPYTKHLFKVG